MLPENAAVGNYGFSLDIHDSIVWGNIASDTSIDSDEIWLEDAGSNTSLDVDLWNTLSNADGIYDPGLRINDPVGFMSDATNLSTNPLFAAAGTDDYTLQGSSPALDRGSGTASALGFDTMWTQSSGVLDTGAVDLGYHWE